MEIISIVCWFNPFFHMIRRELQADPRIWCRRLCQWRILTDIDYASLLLMNDFRLPLFHYSSIF